MTQGRKYAALPDLDESPDTYETPDLTDDNSTLRTSTVRSPSPTGSTASSADLNPSISTSKLQPNQARTQFTSSRVDARDTDFSDRVSSKRKAYVVSSRDQDGGEDWDSEDEEESLQRRLARLNREVLEVQSELDKRQNEQNGNAHAQEEDHVAGKLAELSAALDKMRVSQSAQARLARNLSTPTDGQKDHARIPESTRSEATDEAPDTQSLNKVADFDARLASLERQLGITSLDMPEASKTSSFSPIIPTLSLLDRQLALLTSSPTQPHIEALAQKLQQAQSGATAGSTTTEGEQTTLTQEDMAKLRALYALLPTLTSLSPTLPPLLARLRSLRTLHANAATASQTLDEVEQRQDEADKEIREWRDGLKKVEDAVTRAEGGMRENNAAVEHWVKDLEERVRKLA